MKLKIFVRWDKSHDDAGGRVEVQAGEFGGELGATWFESFTMWSKQCGNNERLYGYCMALKDTLQYQGHEVIWPHCLSGHLCANRERED